MTPRWVQSHLPCRRMDRAFCDAELFAVIFVISSIAFVIVPEFVLLQPTPTPLSPRMFLWMLSLMAGPLLAVLAFGAVLQGIGCARQRQPRVIVMAFSFYCLSAVGALAAHNALEAPGRPTGLLALVATGLRLYSSEAAILLSATLLLGLLVNAPRFLGRALRPDS